jgi:8-amino-7-oxononanoate synthase
MVWQVRHAHEIIKKANTERKKLFDIIEYFHKKVRDLQITNVPHQPGPVQMAVFPGNENAHNVAKAMREKGFEVRAVLSPTVPLGMERLRICLHAYNTKEEVSALVNELRYHV